MAKKRKSGALRAKTQRSEYRARDTEVDHQIDERVREAAGIRTEIMDKISAGILPPRRWNPEPTGAAPKRK